MVFPGLQLGFSGLILGIGWLHFWTALFRLAVSAGPARGRFSPRNERWVSHGVPKSVVIALRANPQLILFFLGRAENHVAIRVPTLAYKLQAKSHSTAQNAKPDLIPQVSALETAAG